MRNVFTIVIVIALVVMISRALGRSNDPNWKFLRTMEPDARKTFEAFLNGIKRLGYIPVIRESNRSAKQQAYYHKQDKRNPPPGKTSHEIGKAVDMDIYKNGKVLSKHTPKALWLNTGVPNLAQSLGIRWGGNFKGYADNNHFDYLRA
jgi:hypothetical protein